MYENIKIHNIFWIIVAGVQKGMHKLCVITEIQWDDIPFNREENLYSWQVGYWFGKKDFQCVL